MARPADDMIPVADVEALISAKVNEATQSMLALLARSETGASAFDPRQLAMAIAEVSDQGNNRKRVAPEELARREDARVKLLDTLDELNTKGTDLEYRLKRKVVLDEQLIEPMWIHPVSKKQMHTTLCWPGIPNEAMEPANDAARDVFALFVTSVGGFQSRNERQRVTPRGVVIVEGHAPTTREAPQVGNGSGGGVKITGRDQPGEVIQTRILGTIAPAARQVNGRAAA